MADTFKKQYFKEYKKTCFKMNVSFHLNGVSSHSNVLSMPRTVKGKKGEVIQKNFFFLWKDECVSGAHYILQSLLRKMKYLTLWGGEGNGGESLMGGYGAKTGKER